MQLDIAFSEAAVGIENVLSKPETQIDELGCLFVVPFVQKELDALLAYEIEVVEAALL